MFMFLSGMRPIKEGFTFTRDPRLKVVSMGAINMDQALVMASRITCEVLNIKATNTVELDEPESYDIVVDQIGKQAKKLERHIVEGTHHVHLNDVDKVAHLIYYFLSS